MGDTSVLATVPASSTTFPSRSEVFASLPRHPSPTRHVDKTCKYPLPAVVRPKDINTRLQEFEKAEPPVYATQTGKAKGRKPKKAVAEPVTQKQQNKKVTHKNNKGKNKNKNKKRLKTAKQRAVAAYKASTQEQMEQPNKTSRRKTKACEVPAAGSSSTTKRKTPPTVPGAKRKSRSKKTHDDQPKQYVPPEHVTGNHVYSSAYRKAISLNLSEEEARTRGQEASAHFKKYGTVVEGMCGMLLGLNLKIHTAYSFPSHHFFVAYVFAFTIWIVRRVCATRIAKSHIEIRFRSKPRANKDVRMAEAPEVDWCTHKHVGVWTAVWCLSLCGVNSILKTHICICIYTSSLMIVFFQLLLIYGDRARHHVDSPNSLISCETCMQLARAHVSRRVESAH